MEIYKNLIITENGSSGRMYVEKYMKNNYIEIYDDVILYCNENLDELPFKEKVYHYVNDIPNLIYCKNENCNQLVKYKDSTLGYYDYCSKLCVSSDPKIKKLKEDKSFEKFGTKAPAMNDKIKEKIKITNNEKYGHNSPLQNEDILKKSKETLYKNYKVCNPNQSEELTKKRTITFSNNLKNKYIELLKPFGIKDIDYQNKIMHFICDICKKDYQLPLDLFHNRKTSSTILCTFCNPINSHVSGLEVQLQQFIKDNYTGDILLNDRKILNPYELDIYIPNLKIAFEFNGLYYHSEKCVENNYHFKKTELAEKNGIKLIQIFEDDWQNKQNIIKSRILNLLKINKNKVFARKTVIKEVYDNILLRNFLNENHIQGFVGSQIKIGLFHNNELISLMTFGNQRKNLGQSSELDTYEMLRFCNKLNINVVGGASKLFKYFIKKYNPKKIITYADRNWSQGEIYYTLGFNFLYKTKPNYYYLINKTRKNRFNYRKDILIKQGFDPNKTEHQIMLDRKIYRIYDSGNLKFIYNP